MIKILITEKLTENGKFYVRHKTLRLFGIKIYDRIFLSKSNDLLNEYRDIEHKTAGFKTE